MTDTRFPNDRPFDPPIIRPAPLQVQPGVMQLGGQGLIHAQITHAISPYPFALRPGDGTSTISPAMAAGTITQRTATARFVADMPKGEIPTTRTGHVQADQANAMQFRGISKDMPAAGQNVTLPNQLTPYAQQVLARNQPTVPNTPAVQTSLGQRDPYPDANGKMVQTTQSAQQYGQVGAHRGRFAGGFGS